MSAKTFEEWALFMHETYERLAPSFGYETRTDTRAFDPESANGRLMIACVAELLNSSRASLLADAPEVEGLVKELREVGWYAESQIDDIIDALLSQAARIKEFEDRLEIPTQGEFKHLDGIACRDETIRLQDEAFVRLQAELAAANKLIDDEKTGKLISYLNVLAQENKILRRMSHADRAEKAEAERDAEVAQMLSDVVPMPSDNRGVSEGATGFRNGWNAARDFVLARIAAIDRERKP